MTSPLTLQVGYLYFQSTYQFVQLGHRAALPTAVCE